MNSEGFCQYCPDNCFWEEHANTPYLCLYTKHKIKKTYADMRQKYKDASGKLPNQKTVARAVRSRTERFN